MCSCALISAVKGMLIRLMTSTSRDVCSTTAAAPIRSTGITILWFRYHRPTVSVSRPMTRQNPAITTSDVPKITLSLAASPFPSPTVMYRLMAPATVFITSMNRVTTPPTALYTP